ncbi:MAG: 4'-phosphopantetheinyl transferase family protein [Solirubrobacterales bacterium]
MLSLPAPAHPDLHPGEVHVWRLELDDPRWPGPQRLPAAERERAEGFLRAQLGARWTAARWGLRGALARYLDEKPETIELTEDERGKPRLAREPRPLRFNLSHSEALALVAVCRDREVGVDVERIEPARDLVSLAERALEPADAAAVREADEPGRTVTFYELWSRHEARLKCLGAGLGEPLPQDAPRPAVETVEVGDGYAAAVAVAAPAPLPLRCWTFGLPLREDG